MPEATHLARCKGDVLGTRGRRIVDGSKSAAPGTGPPESKHDCCQVRLVALDMEQERAALIFSIPRKGQGNTRRGANLPQKSTHISRQAVTLQIPGPLLIPWHMPAWISTVGICDNCDNIQPVNVEAMKSLHAPQLQPRRIPHQVDLYSQQAPRSHLHTGVLQPVGE